MKKIKRKGEIRQNDMVEIHQDCSSLGAGTEISHTYEEIFAGEVSRVIMDRDTVHWKTKKITRKVLAVWKSVPPHTIETQPSHFINIDMSEEKNKMDRLVHKCMTSNIDSKNWRKRRLEADEAMEEHREKVLKSHRIDNIRDHDKEYEDYTENEIKLLKLSQKS